MGRTRPPYPPEFRAEAVRLVRSGAKPLREADDELLRRIVAIHTGSRGTYGVPRIYVGRMTGSNAVGALLVQRDGTSPKTVADRSASSSGPVPCGGAVRLRATEVDGDDR